MKYLQIWMMHTLRINCSDEWVPSKVPVRLTMAERPEDLNLPAAVVARLMKDALPEGCSVSKEARQSVCRAASVFVLYLTSQSNTIVSMARSKRKTVSGADVISALSEMDFEEFADPLKEALEDHKSRQKTKKLSKKRKADESGAGDADDAAEKPADGAD
ncbi:LOW QUALITY PROTEIN: DNA polymerase epsilon subunit 3-like [Pollicipes pollicipes]|uniref:LOW QUALITY PROTEIN: DNA polymerase epsilon subunit 3-like n=1 Tax=Pollicipes pollicipes TaxID=41117 RepID=UPI001884B043|nr:LOW QUALITY PROTEIN: DNA polymerase epsilon subunit 3-like [Pollicipes pollicipes]